MNDQLLQRLLSLLDKKKWTPKNIISLCVVVTLLVLGIIYGGPHLGIVLSIGQKGGQTAETIINTKPTDRQLDDELISELDKHLSAYKGQRVSVSHTIGNSEANQLANEITEYLQKSGWEVFRYQEGDPIPPGISYKYTDAGPVIQVGENT